MTTVSSGQIRTVSSGQTDTGDLVLSGGSLAVASGGTASGTVVSSGGAEVVYDTAVATTINSGGSLNAQLGAIFAGAVVDNGLLTVNAYQSPIYQSASISASLSGSGTVVIAAGGHATLAGGDNFSGTIDINGTRLELASAAAAGTASIVFLGANGVLQIDGASMSSNTVSGFAPGDVIDFAGVPYSATASATITSGNFLQLQNGTTYGIQLDPAQNLSGFLLNVTPDGSGGTRVVAGNQITVISAGQTSSSPIVSSGAFQDIFGSAVSASVLNGGEQDVVSGGTATATLINSGGVANVFAGGAVVSSVVDAGGTASSTILSGGGSIYDQGILIGAVIKFGYAYISSGGNTTGTIISNGSEVLFSGATEME